MDKPLTEQEQNVVLMWCLRDLWDEHTPAGDPTGDRIFLRCVDWRPEEMGWSDWNFVGTVVRSGDQDRISFLCTADTDRTLPDMIAADLRAGAVNGRYEFAEGVVVWWVRYTGDGPEGERTEDWGPNED